MRDIQKLFISNNSQKGKIDFSKRKIWFVSHDSEFSGETISKIISYVNKVHHKYKGQKIPFVFQFYNVSIADKLSYIIFECICYSLIKDYGHKIYIEWQPQSNILTDGVFSSPLKLLNTEKKKSEEKFIKSFEFDIYLNHFRKVVKGNERKNTNYLGNLDQELNTFMKIFNIEESYRDQITEVIIELVGNACEHADADCLLDIDITNDHLKEIKKVKQEGFFYGVNISIINFSDTLLGDGVKDKITNNLLTEPRYKELQKAYSLHEQFFSSEYTETDFCNIASLQDKISGRLHHGISGGTGLTKLIHSLQEKSDMDACYVISGDRCILFEEKYLRYDDNMWLGFNESQDFFNAIPSSNILAKCLIFFPGTAYNLNFVLKRED